MTMPLSKHTGALVEDVVPVRPLSEVGSIQAVRVVDRTRYCQPFVGRTVTVAFRVGHARPTSATGHLEAIVRDPARGQDMLLLCDGERRLAIYVGHLTAIQPQSA
jgi:hypothetical protein